MPDLAVFLATSGHSGVDRIMTNLLPALVGLGLTVDLLSLAGHGPELSKPPHGLKVVPLGRAHVNTALPALVRYLRQQRPAVLLSDKDRVNRTAIMACKLAGVDTRVFVRLGTTVSVNLADRKRLEQWQQLLSIRHLYPKADGVLVPSQGSAKDLRHVSRHKIERLHVVPSPIIHNDLEQLATDQSALPANMDQEGPWIVAIGELSHRKNYSMLLRAFAKVLERRPARLMILGEGRERGSLESLAATLGVTERVRLCGFVNNPYPFLKNAQVFAHSSRWEGLPVVLVEAMALGVPVVSTDCPSGPREILDGGRLGTLVDVGDADAMASGICRYLDEAPDPEPLKRAVDKYRVMESARAYMKAMGL
ncbi:MAG: glycosyltransferase [Pseudomonadota bacterium]